MTHDELRDYMHRILPLVERRNEWHIVTKVDIDQLVSVLRFVYRNMGHHGPGHDMLPEFGLAGAAEILWENRERGDGWKQQPPEYHIDHAIAHLENQKAGDKSEQHIKHASCRALMACHLLALADEHDAVD